VASLKFVTSSLPEIGKIARELAVKFLEKEGGGEDEKQLQGGADDSGDEKEDGAYEGDQDQKTAVGAQEGPDSLGQG